MSDDTLLVLFGIGIPDYSARGLTQTLDYVAKTFGDGFWSLIPFTMQMALIILTGYAVGSLLAGRPFLSLMH